MSVQIGNNASIQTINPFIKPEKTGATNPAGKTNYAATIDMTSNNPAVKNAGVQEGVGDKLELSTKKADENKEKDLLGQGGSVKDQMKNQEGKKSWNDKLQNLIGTNKASSTQSNQSLTNVKAQSVTTQASLNKLNAEALAVGGENEALTTEEIELGEQDIELEEKEVELTEKQTELEEKIKNGENVEENQTELESIGGELTDIGGQRGEIMGQREVVGGQLLTNTGTLGNLNMGINKDLQNINQVADKAMLQAKAQQAAAGKAQQTSQAGQTVGQTMSTIGGLGTSVGGAMTAFFPTAPAGVPITNTGIGLGVAGSGVSAFSQEGGITAEGAMGFATNAFSGASTIKNSFKTPTPPPTNKA